MTGPRQSPDERSIAFDRALGRAARSLIEEPLPDGILDTEPGPRRSWRRSAGWLPAAAASLILVVLVGLGAIRGGFLSAGSQRPEEGLRTLRAVIGDLTTTGYSCRISLLGTPGPSVGSGYVCLTPKRLLPLNAAVILEALPDGGLQRITVKTDAIAPGAAGAEAHAAAVSFLRDLGAGFFVDPDTGTQARDWIAATLASMATGGEAATRIGGIDLALSVDALGRFHLEASRPGS
jgi:hypothetical protein